ncbi:MAG: hypothetical protein COV75_02830 [Candidatus Omnitrophica bacterium CG11_big_fil_rev_8_21_14_0_20_63_9]|nr:MAG: hypothetical protein COV75_02830 [Candidatus Omnitrophica bacterium CG11_big_fil_rev_8_21_14_0_20_63_9]
MHQAVGEIVWLDTQLGKLQLYADRSRGTRATAEYSITEHETRVTVRRDQQFLAITDLRAGQQVTIESKDNGEEQLATKITVEPSSAPLFQRAEGTIESIDVTPGTFTLKETASLGAAGVVSVFVFNPRDIVVMESPSLQPVRLAVQPGDFVKVEYVVSNGRRHARSMMRYSAVPGSTTTTTTTTSTTTTSQ